MTGELVRMESQAVIQQERMELSVDEIVAKVAKVREVAAKVMKEDIHYGVIPGTPKPTLYKAGGEILCLTFRLAPKYEWSAKDLGHGHLEYIVRCELTHIHTNEFYGAGMGSCSTMENKYRYRPGPVTPTGRPVPKDYWNVRNSDPAKAKAMLGGHGYQAKKIDGKWEIVEQGETIENPNPADLYNTVLKMGCKRAYVSAVLSATAASEVYTQDLEDMVDTPEPVVEKPKASAPPTPPPAQPEPDIHDYAPDDTGDLFDQPPAQPASTGAPVISDAQRKRAYAIGRGAGMTDKQFEETVRRYGFASSKDITKGVYEALVAELQAFKP